RTRGRASVSRRGRRNASAGNGRYYPSSVNLADTIVERIGNVNRSVSIDRDTGRRGQLCLNGRSAVTRVTTLRVLLQTALPVPSDGSNDPLRGTFADAIVAGIGDIQIPAGVRCQRPSIKLGLQRRPSVTGKTRLAGSCDCRNDAVGGYLA